MSKMMTKYVIKLKPCFQPALLNVMALLISFCSPLHPFAKQMPGTGSSAFLLIGKSMSKGIMPYTDLFDHKGPMLYVINWLGMLIGFMGVWLIELACMLLSVFLCYKTARRFFSESASFLGTTATFIALLSWFEGGNLTESYALPFFFGALYCLTGYFVQNFELNRKQIFISGLCMGGVLMLKPNMVSLWIGMCTVIFIHSLVIRKFRSIFRHIVFFAAGVLVLILPFIVWLIAKGSLNDFYRCYFQFNFEYVDVPFSAVIKSMYKACHYPIIPIVAAILITLFFKQEDRKSFKFILILSMIAVFGATILLSSLSGLTMSYYYIMYLPCLILPITWTIELVIAHIRIKPIIILVIISLVLNQSLFIGARMLRNTMRTDYDGNAIASFIKENTTPDESILYIGNYCSIYFLSDRSPAGYYPYYTPLSMDYPSVITAYIDELALNKPRLIAYGNRELPDAFDDYINENYTVIYEYKNHVICTLRE